MDANADAAAQSPRAQNAATMGSPPISVGPNGRINRLLRATEDHNKRRLSGITPRGALSPGGVHDDAVEFTHGPNVRAGIFAPLSGNVNSRRGSDAAIGAGQDLSAADYSSFALSGHGL